MEEKISVIVPVYNMERYLKRCINSLISQTYSNLEIILVDDGSTDMSPMICDEYESQDSRIKVIHKNNEGVSEARNTGIDVCTGKYIAFVDSDDYCMKNMYEILYDCMCKHKVDVSVCCYQYETETGDWAVGDKSIPANIDGVYSAEKFTEFLYGGGYINGIVCSPWNKLFRRQLFDDIRFEGNILDDEEVNDKILAKGVSVFVSSDILYIYCQNRDSITNQSFKNNRYRFFKILEKRIASFPESRVIVNKTKLLYCNMYIEYYFRAKEVGIIPYYDKKHFQLFRKEVQADAKTRLRFLLFGISPFLYQTMLKWKSRDKRKKE